MKTLFHHFTAIEYLPSIAVTGLRKGDVPTSPTQGVNAVWLTTKPDPTAHGLGQARPLTAKERLFIVQQGGHVPDNARFPDKRRVRLSVELEEDPILLRPWKAWALANGVSRNWRRTLERSDGAAAETWWLYFGVIRPTQLVATDLQTGLDIEGWPHAFTQSPNAGVQP